MRIAPLPPEVSDFIVRRVLEEAKILIQGGNHRVLTSNRQRRENGNKLLMSYRLQADEPREFDPEEELEDEQDEGNCCDVDRMLHEYYKAHSLRQTPQRSKSQEVHNPLRAESCDVQDLMGLSDSNRPYNFSRNGGDSSASTADCKPPRTAEDATLPARSPNFSRSPPVDVNNDDETLEDDSGCDSETFNFRETGASNAQVKRATVVMLEKKAKFFEAWANIAVQVQQSLKEITDVFTASLSGSHSGMQTTNK